VKGDTVSVPHHTSSFFMTSVRTVVTQLLPVPLRSVADRMAPKNKGKQAQAGLSSRGEGRDRKRTRSASDKEAPVAPKEGAPAARAAGSNTPAVKATAYRSPKHCMEAMEELIEELQLAVSVDSGVETTNLHDKQRNISTYLQIEPKIGTFVNRARLMNAWFMKFHSDTLALPEGDAIRTTRQEALNQAAGVRDRLSNLWALRFPHPQDREAYKNPAPVKVTVEQQLSNLSVQMTAMQSTIGRVLSILESGGGPSEAHSYDDPMGR
jgi:hypothetical protein